MSKRLLTIFLIISFAFNLAVMSMFIYLTFFKVPPCPPPRPEELRGGPHGQDGPPLGLHSGMMQRLNDNREKMQPYHEKFIKEKMSFLQTVAREDFTESEANKALETSLQAHQELERALGKNLITMRKGMSKEEAKEFYNRLIERQKYKDAPMGRRGFGKGRNRQMHNQDTN